MTNKRLSNQEHMKHFSQAMKRQNKVLSRWSEPFSIRWQMPRDFHPWRAIRSTGILGMVIAVPTLMGVAMGLWIDTLWPTQYSWFPILAPTGFGLGWLSAFFWSSTEQHNSP
jgi:ATP synthase protein I